MKHRQQIDFLPMVRCTLFILTLFLPSVSGAASNSYLELTCNGTQIPGEPSVTNVGGLDVSNQIEVLSFGLNASVAVDASTGQSTGRRLYRPVRILKRIDSASPLLHQALAQSQSCEALIRFFRPSPGGEGTTEHFYTVELSNAVLVGIMPSQPSSLDPASSQLPFLESFSIAFGTITTTYEPTGASHQDDWRAPR